MQNTSKVLRGQSLIDMVCQESGSINAIVAAAFDNGVSITDDLEVSSTISIRQGERMRKKPATAIHTNPQEEIQPEGIGYWAISGTFKVS